MTMSPRSTATVEHPVFARLYARASERESDEQIAHRRQTLAGLAGRVVEVGAGNGRNFGFYPAAVQEVVAVEPERHLRELALAAARDAPVAVQILDALAGELPFEDASFDAAYLVTVLGEVPDQSAAMRELARVLRPGGRLVVGELMGDPHYVGIKSMRLRAAAAGLDFESKVGNRLGFFARFRKPGGAS